MTRSIQRFPVYNRFQQFQRLGRFIGILAIAGFIVISLVAKWAPLQAQETSVPKKKASYATQKKEKSKPAASRPVTGTRMDAMALAKFIDQEIQRLLASEKIPVSPLSDDAEFLRRVYLDLAGVIPPPEKVTAFLSSKDPAKRAKVIDELLADSRFGSYLSEVWSGLMLPRESNNRRLDHTPMQKWLTDNFNKNKPLDKLVYELLTSSGPQNENGAVTYFIGNPTVDKMTDNVSRLFLGVQLQCAQCHNHPFTDYKQNEYWGMAAFFMKVKLTANPQQAAKKGIAPGIFESPGPAKGKKNVLPESAKIVPAKFLQGEEPKINDKDPARPVLAGWITSPNNPFFTQAMVNRFWYQLFGRGIVNPVDDMHEDNSPSHPDLLTALTEQFKANGFDTKYLIRAICNSAAYQRTSKPTGDNKADTVYQSHRLVRVMTPEQLFDSLATVLGKSERGEKGGKNKKAAPVGTREIFLNFFRIDEGTDPLEYQVGIPQALRLMNSAQVNNFRDIADQAMKSSKNPTEIIENLFLRTVSRPPSPQEVQHMTAHVSKATDPRTGYGDILWALLNSSEFTLNH